MQDRDHAMTVSCDYNTFLNNGLSYPQALITDLEISSTLLMKTNKMHNIFSQFIASTCFGHFWPSSGCAVTEYNNSTISAFVKIQLFINMSSKTQSSCLMLIIEIKKLKNLFLISIVNIQHDGWVLDDTFVNKCILTHGYSVTAYPGDGQKWPKHVDAMNWENLYRLCILFVFINNYNIMHGVERIKYLQPLTNVNL